MGDVVGAVEAALAVADAYPEDDTPRLLTEQIIAALPRIPPSHQAQTLQALARLPVSSLKLEGHALISLAPLRGMPLQQLQCSRTQLTDLSSLHGISLRQFNCAGNAITDLIPLTGMPLTVLNCSANRIHDLTPLRGMPLQTLYCTDNAIDDLSPLAGMPLEDLICEGIQFCDLTPLHGLPLRLLYCSRNRVADLSALTGMPLLELFCAHNRITDLAPLRGMSLITLYCQNNNIDDLSPIAGLPLRRLHCGDNPITSLLPLRGMHIEELGIENIPLHTKNVPLLWNLPLRHLICDFMPAALALLQSHTTLKGMNHHNIAYLRDMGERFSEVLGDWQQGAGPGNTTLQSTATASGSERYLSMPFRMSRRQAESFSRYCGGTLACPATAEQFQALLDYLATVIYPGSELYYHLGLTIDPPPVCCAGSRERRTGGRNGGSRKQISATSQPVSRVSSVSRPPNQPTGTGIMIRTRAITWSSNGMGK